MGRENQDKICCIKKKKAYTIDDSSEDKKTKDAKKCVMKGKLKFEKL